VAIDYKSFQEGGQSSPENNDRRWWKLKNGEEVSSSITGLLQFLRSHQSDRQTQILISARLYGNLSLMGLNGLTYSKVAAAKSAIKDRITYNVCQSAVDTITSKIAKNKPKPLFLTSGGDHKIQRRAKKLDKFVDGVFYENDAYTLGKEIFRDATIWGTGCVHVYRSNNRVRYERVLASELFVDEVEGFYGKPRQLHRVKNVDREVLIEEFPNKEKLIRNAKKASNDALGGYENISDVITVRESWHLPSGQDADDGRHVISIDEGELFSEKYERDHFPFVFFHWSKRLFGFWGQGLIEQIQSIQLELNKLLWVIQRSLRLAGSFKILLENGSKIVKEHLNNEIGAIVNYTGTAPTYVTPPAVQPELYQQVMALKAAAFEQAGISQLSAQAKKPDGLDSGKALREYNDIESDRFTTVGQAYEQFYLDLAKLSIEQAREIYEDDKNFEVRVPGKKFIQTIDWKDIDLSEDQYVMKVYPVSSLPNDPAGRLATVQEYAMAGYITPRQARRLLDFPDLEQVESLANAQEDYLHDILEKIVDEGIYTAPEPQDDLALAKELGLEYYAQGKMNGLEEDKLEKLRQFMEQVDGYVMKATQPPAPPQSADPSAMAGLADPMAIPGAEGAPMEPMPPMAA
jgi:hypothetical protein